VLSYVWKTTPLKLVKKQDMLITVTMF